MQENPPSALSAKYRCLCGRSSRQLIPVAQLLREVVGNTYFPDGMELSLQEVGVPLLVSDHAIEQSLRAAVPHVGADLRGIIVLAHRILLVLEVDFHLLLDLAAKSGLQSHIDTG